jgi:hypothetical protein
LFRFWVETGIADKLNGKLNNASLEANDKKKTAKTQDERLSQKHQQNVFCTIYF